MIFEEYVKENRQEFLNEIIALASDLSVAPEDLMFVIWFETAKTFSPSIQSKFTKATGLLQFMPSTAIWLGTTIDELKKMTNIQQMEYVRMYLLPFKGRYKDYVDLYCSIFWPAAVGKPDTFRITHDLVARQNPIFDINRDLDIEKSEIRETLMHQIPLKYRGFFNGRVYKSK